MHQAPSSRGLGFPRSQEASMAGERKRGDGETWYHQLPGIQIPRPSWAVVRTLASIISEIKKGGFKQIRNRI